MKKASYSAREIAWLLGVSPRAVYNLIQEGSLGGFKVGKGPRAQWRIPRPALERWLAAQGQLELLELLDRS